MPRILRIINRFNLGGPTYNAAYLSRYLPPEFETKLIGGVPQPSEAHSGFILDNLGVPYEEIPTLGRSINPADDFRSFMRIRSIIREYKPDIVHTHAAKAGALGRIAARMAGVPVIIHTFHGHVFDGYFSSWKSSLARMAERKLAGISTAIIAISETQKYDLTVKYGIAPPEKVHVIPLGLDLDRFQINVAEKRKQFRHRYELDDVDVAIGIIGRLTAIKQHELFIKSIQHCLAGGVKCKAFIIGDGERFDELKQLCLDHGLRISDNSAKQADIVFTSWLRNVDEVCAGLDIVSLTSLNEGTPVSLIEAQATSRAVISTRVGGVADVIVNNRSGIIVDSFDHVKYGNAIISLINQPSLRIEMGVEGRNYVLERFSKERLVRDMDMLYKSLLSKHTG
ncbi:MAG: hypothetical protein RL220_1076 [Bacteroidota bacterium]